MTVSARIESSRSPSIKVWWAQVTATPEARSTAVFSKGIENGFKGSIPIGGQQQPSSGLGARLLWKNAQKNAKKNSTSDAMNKIIPHRRPLETMEVWCPRKVPSRIMSRHHCSIVKRMIEMPSKAQLGP